MIWVDHWSSMRERSSWMRTTMGKTRAARAHTRLPSDTAQRIRTWPSLSIYHARDVAHRQDCLYSYLFAWAYTTARAGHRAQRHVEYSGLHPYTDHCQMAFVSLLPAVHEKCMFSFSDAGASVRCPRGSVRLLCVQRPSQPICKHSAASPCTSRCTHLAR